MQGISPLVSERKAQLGDIIRSTTKEKLGDPEHPVNVIPLRMDNSWVNYEVVGTKPEFRGIEPRTASNENLEWEYMKNGTTWQRKKAITLFALLPQDVAAYTKEVDDAIAEGRVLDITRTLLPVVFSFQSTSYKTAAKPLASFFKAVEANARNPRFLEKGLVVAPYQYVLPLACHQEKNDKGQYYVFSIGQAKGVTDKDVLAEATRWYNILNSGRQIKVDDSLGDSEE